MTDFEKKIRRYHNKKMKYNKDPEALINRLRRKEAGKYDFAEDRDDIGYYMLDKKYSYPRKPRKKVHFWRRVIVTLLAIVIIILLTMWATNRVGWQISIIGFRAILY